MTKKIILSIILLIFLYGCEFDPITFEYASPDLFIICGGNDELEILCIDNLNTADEVNLLEDGYILSIFLILMSCIWILIYYSIRLDEIMIPIRILFLACAFLLLLNMSWVAQEAGTIYDISAHARSMIETLYIVLVSTSLIFAAGLIVLTFWSSYKKIVKN